MSKPSLRQVGQHGVDRADFVQLDDVQLASRLAVGGRRAVGLFGRQRRGAVSAAWLSATASSPPVFSSCWATKASSCSRRGEPMLLAAQKDVIDRQLERHGILPQRRASAG